MGSKEKSVDEAARQMKSASAPAVHRAREVISMVIRNLEKTDYFGNITSDIIDTGSQIGHSISYKKTMKGIFNSSQVITHLNKQIAISEAELVRSRFVASAFKNRAAESASVFIENAIPSIRNSVASETENLRRMFKNIDEIDKATKGKKSKIFDVAAKYMEETRVGKWLYGNRTVFGAAADLTGGLFDAISVLKATAEGYEETSGRTATKVAGAGVRGLIVAGSEFVVKRNPLMGLLDAGIGVAFGKENTVSNYYDATGKMFSAYIDFAVSGDIEPLNNIHKINMSGENGMVLQGYAMIGEELAQSGWVEKAFNFSDAIISNISNVEKTAKTWRDTLVTSAGSLEHNVEGWLRRGY